MRSPVPTASQQSSQLEQELVEVKGLLRSAEERNGELAEQLKNANASVEQYRAVVLTLEDSLKKEKEVLLFVYLYVLFYNIQAKPMWKMEKNLVMHIFLIIKFFFFQSVKTTDITTFGASAVTLVPCVLLISHSFNPLMTMSAELICQSHCFCPFHLFR